MSGERLEELPEAAAAGRIAELYADIRAVLGLPMVNLVYRHLATRPGALERCWKDLHPNLDSQAAALAARELARLASPGDPVPVPAAALAVAGLTADRARLARATLAAYRRANSLNALAMAALLDGCPGGGESSSAGVPPAEPILPMASLENLPPPTLALLDEMSVAVVGDEEPRLVPSLFRHFATDGCVLALAWTVLRPAIPEAVRLGEVVAGRARTLAPALPHPVGALQDEGERAVASTFAQATARMLVVGEILSAALAEVT